MIDKFGGRMSSPKLLDVVSAGEVLVDFFPERAGARVRDIDRWRRHLGGAPANVAIGVARLGGHAAFAGAVGEDELGYFLRDELARERVDVRFLVPTREGTTGIVFIALSSTGERSFSHYRARAADGMFEQVRFPKRVPTKVLHCAPSAMISPASRAAMLAVARKAAKDGRLVSVDPNLRLDIWRKPAELRRFIRELFGFASIVKLADNELEFCTGEKTPERALAKLSRWGVALPAVTLGGEGAIFLWNGALHRAPAPKVKVVDTTGAGDGFVAGLLYGLTRLVERRDELEDASVQQVHDAVSLGCRVGARVVTKLGAVTALPTAQALGLKGAGR